MKETIAAFDFDETLIQRDTLLDFAYHSIPHLQFFMKALTFAPTLVQLKTGSITNQVAKERFLKLFFGGMSLAEFDELGKAYVPRLNKLTNPDALAKLKWHQKEGHRTIIVSASAENWIKPWAKLHGIDEVIATRLEIKKDQVTGRIDGKNCHGPEKVIRFLAAHPDRKQYELIFYGDGKSDKQMFELADTFYRKTFN